jgi:non-specific serine/threonine protein kinase
VQQEWVLPIGGMDYPETANADAVNYNAVQLFGSCALRVRPRFSLEEDLESVVKICQLVEGMPLSIELAAAWLRVLPASEIAQQIDLKFLSSQARDMPERHRSVDTIFDYSWKMLSEQEARTLMKLSVFKGPFDRAAAIQVAGATIIVLAALIEKSLIRLVDETYYDIHELLRQYAFNQLTEAREAVATQDAHLAYYVTLTSDPDSKLHGKQQLLWLDRLKREHDNLRTALGWALAHTNQTQRESGLALGASIWEFWLMRGHITEGRQWLDRLLASTDTAPSQARGAAAHGAGYLAWIQGEYDRAEALHHEALTIRRTLEDKAGIAGSSTSLGLIAWSRGDFGAAHEYYEQALALYREINHPHGIATVLMHHALLLHNQNEYGQAITFAEEAWAIFKELDDLQGMTLILYHVGAMTYDRGDWERARTLEEEALDLARQLGDERVIGVLLEELGQTLIGLGEYELAHSALNESLQLVTQAGDRTHIALVKKSMARLALHENRRVDAQSLIAESLRILRTLQSKVLLGEALLTYGDIQWTFADCRTAESTYREALTLLLGVKNAQAIAQAQYRLAGTAFEQGEITRTVVMISRADAIAQQFDLRFPDKPERLDRDALKVSLTPAIFEQAMQTSDDIDFP